LVKKLDLEDRLDITLNYKVPKELQEQVGSETIDVKMIEDLGQFPEEHVNSIANAILEANTTRLCSLLMRDAPKPKPHVK
jgi:hypothetical protein